MLNLYIIQARFGDCFILEYGRTNPEYILIDGGPSRNYDNFLKPALPSIMKNSNSLEAVIISHVDNDHILGILDLFADLKYQQDADREALVNIQQLWFNAFKNTIETGNLEERMNKVNTFAGVNGLRMQEMNMVVNGVKEGHQLITLAGILKIPVNPDAPNNAYIAQNPIQVIPISNLEITVVGPTQKNIKKLQKKWEEWIETNEQQIREGKYTKGFAAMQDQSIPNLSSLVLLVKGDGRTILFTGDCRGDHLQQGLIETGLSSDGKFHVDIFKVPHHGSQRNVTRQFFKEVTGNIYVISADGTYNNPDYETLTWIVETANEAGRKIELIFTNQTDATKNLIKEYPPSEWYYQVKILKTGDNFIKVYD